MTEGQIQEFESLTLANKLLLSSMDYVVSQGKTYEVHANEFAGEFYVKEVDSVPDGYWGEWEHD